VRVIILVFDSTVYDCCGHYDLIGLREDEKEDMEKQFTCRLEEQRKRRGRTETPYSRVLDTVFLLPCYYSFLP
jgi:hypothetical protein